MSNKAVIHQTAVIDPAAKIGKGTSVGPYTVIGPEVVIGENNRIGSHVVIEGKTAIGDENHIFQFASIGAEPQDLKFHGEKSSLEIGSKNIIREFVTIQPGTEGGRMITTIGSECLFMTGAHVAHDVVMGDHCIMVNNAALAGHVEVGHHVIMGAMTGYHQFIRLGSHAIISGGSIVTKDVSPYCTAQGDRAGLVGINKVGLQRAGFSDDDIKLANSLYRELFLAAGTIKEKLPVLAKQYPDNQVAQEWIAFLSSSERGFVTARKNNMKEVE